jgi:GNAT superfamily N-acetyltransferase
MPPYDFTVLNGEQASARLDELAGLYAEVYAEPPYEWGEDHVALFRERFEVQRRQAGFRLVTARADGQLVGLAFGVTLLPTTPWWQNLVVPLPEEITTERPGRTFAVVEMLVRAPWRRQHIAQKMHQLLLQDRPEERATLTVLPEAEPAKAAYRQWGWQTVGRKR